MIFVMIYNLSLCWWWIYLTWAELNSNWVGQAMYLWFDNILWFYYLLFHASTLYSDFRALTCCQYIVGICVVCRMVQDMWPCWWKWRSCFPFHLTITTEWSTQGRWYDWSFFQDFDGNTSFFVRSTSLLKYGFNY